MDQEVQLPTARRRGRPPGTGRDDSAMLTAVADVLQAKPGTKATTAMRRLAKGAATDSDLRRLQVKWKAEGDRRMAEAGARAREREKRREQDRSQTAAMTAAEMAVRVIGMAHPALPVGAGEHYALMLGITAGTGSVGQAYSSMAKSMEQHALMLAITGGTGSIGQACSSVAESVRVFQEAGRADPAHDLISKYASATGFPGVDVTGSAASVLSKRLEELSRIVGVPAETAVSKHLREMVESTNHLIDFPGVRRRS